jgi:glycosyltransferase involved in cell wall biosynthesis
MSLIFLQPRAHRAGAQVALSRLLSVPAMRELNPTVVLGAEGWLAEDLRAHGIAVLIRKFPSTRSWLGRIGANRLFIRALARTLGARPLAVIANNHQDAVLAAGIARILDTRSAVILRDSWLTREALEKYAWDAVDHTFAVGPHLARLATSIDASVPVTTIYDSVAEEDFAAPKPVARKFPERVLVIGSRDERKGWNDLASAVAIARAQEPSLAKIRFEFTDEPPSDPMFFRVDRPRELKSLAREYGLVINPSRRESFGLAAVETLAAGVPLLSTNAGVIGNEIRLPEPFIMPAAKPLDMATSLLRLFRSWPPRSTGVRPAQDMLRRKYTPRRTAIPVLAGIKRMHVGRRRSVVTALASSATTSPGSPAPRRGDRRSADAAKPA